MSPLRPFTSHRRAPGVALAGLTMLAVFGNAVPAWAGDRAPAPRETSLVGMADLKTVPGVRLHFAFDAHAIQDKEKEATGTFLIRHTEGLIDVWQTGTITCLQVGGPVAVASGTVTDSNDPTLIGRKAGFTVYDHGRRDRLNASWDMGFTGTPPPCMSTAPTGEIETGNFVIRS